MRENPAFATDFVGLMLNSWRSLRRSGSMDGWDCCWGLGWSGCLGGFLRFSDLAGQVGSDSDGAGNGSSLNHSCSSDSSADIRYLGHGCKSLKSNDKWLAFLRGFNQPCHQIQAYFTLIQVLEETLAQLPWRIIWPIEFVHILQIIVAGPYLLIRRSNSLK